MAGHLEDPSPSKARMEQDKTPANDNQKHSWDTQLQYGSTMDRLTEQIGKSIAEKLNNRGAAKKEIQQKMKPLNTQKATTERQSINHGAKLQDQYKNHAQPAQAKPEKVSNSQALLNKYGASELKAQTVQQSAPSQQHSKTNSSQLLQKYGAPEVKSQTAGKNPAVTKGQAQQKSALAEKYVKEQPKQQQQQQTQEQTKPRSR